MGKKSIQEMNEELAKLTMEIKRLKAETRLEHARAGARIASGKASLSLARAKHGRRKARFFQLRDKFLAKGYPLGRAAKAASRELKRL